VTESNDRLKLVSHTSPTCY